MEREMMAVADQPAAGLPERREAGGRLKDVPPALRRQRLERHVRAQVRGLQLEQDLAPARRARTNRPRSAAVGDLVDAPQAVNEPDGQLARRVRAAGFAR